MNHIKIITLAALLSVASLQAEDYWAERAQEDAQHDLELRIFELEERLMMESTQRRLEESRKLELLEELELRLEAE